jgi:SynChlorMet cassette protein ScmD
MSIIQRKAEVAAEVVCPFFLLTSKSIPVRIDCYKIEAINMDGEREIKIDSSSLVMAKPGIVLQEEADHWGILYNPETDISFGINTVSVSIWKEMKNKRTVEELVNKVQENCIDVPREVKEHVIQFIGKLLEKGLATLETVG